VVATEACRRAANCQSFIDRVAEETGLEVEIISASEEARLALAGCAPLLDRRYRHALVFDIGGGSTELMWIELQRGMPVLLDQVSLPLGVVGLAERYGGDRVPGSAYQAMIREVGGAIAGFEARNAIADAVARGAVHMVGISGTVTTLAGIHLGLPRYQRALIDGLTLRTDHARAVANRLRKLDFHARAAYPCIGRERADLVVAGCAVLEAICDIWPVTSLRIADRGLREGILLDLLAAA
jgi:exopolyphosphatase/guanosine-5'-triphosphate,3'-diphosphate pyrophosphatase